MEEADPRQDYYLLGIIDFLRIAEPSSFALHEVIEHCSGFVEGGLTIRKGLPAVKAALGKVASIGVIEELEDAYAGPHYVVVGSIDGLEQKLLGNSRALDSYLKLGDGGADWLGRAFVGIERSKENSTRSETRLAEDKWEPLPLDVSEPAIRSAIEGAQKAIEGIRADNGFAAEHPAERDSLVAHAESTLASATNGKVTRSQVTENFVKAGKWLAEKFSGTAIGALGSELVKWGLRLLGFLP